MSYNKENCSLVYKMNDIIPMISQGVGLFTFCMFFVK